MSKNGKAQDQKLKDVYQKLNGCLRNIKLAVAGRVLYFDAGLNAFILAMHSTSPEKTYEATSLAWDSIPKELKSELEEAHIGFAGKQI